MEVELEITDHSVIEDIKFKYPELMSSDAKDLILQEHSNILLIEDELSSLRDSVRAKEALLEEKKKAFAEMTQQCEITYGKKSKYWHKDDLYASFENTGDAYQRVINRS